MTNRHMLEGTFSLDGAHILLLFSPDTTMCSYCLSVWELSLKVLS